MKVFPSHDTPEIFWQALSGAGLVQGEMPDGSAKVHGDGSPWFIKVMLGLAAWLSAIFFLLFIGLFMGELFRNEWVRAILGIIACVLAALCFRKTTSSAFIEQLTFILALLGQGLVLSAIWFGWSNWMGWTESYVPWLLTVLFETAVLVAIPYLPNRFISALAALACLYFALLFWFISLYTAFYTELFYWVLSVLFVPLCLALLALVLHYQWRLPRLLPAVALALILVPFFIAGTQNILKPSEFSMLRETVDASGNFEALRRISLIAVWLGVVYTLLKRVTDKPLSPENLGVWLFALLLAAGTWPVPMALFALAVFSLGFSQRNKVLEGIGILQLLWSIGYYYYALDDTLLFKSLMLSALGAVLLMLYATSHYLLSKTSRNEGEKV